MNVHELNEFKLEDTVKFHDRLNPRLWGRDEHLLPDVRKKLLEIAADFQEFLGLPDLDVKDITISGSNAAYSYSPNSDIDLHLVVTMPQDASEVYQELFNAKKYQYNDLHNIKIGGADVELYVQPDNEPAVSQGIYSITDNKWISVPRRKKAQIDDACVRHKVEDIAARIKDAIDSGDEQRMITLKDKIKRFRQSGLDKQGEFGCDNLTFKVLRNQGEIKKLFDAINAAKDQRLSLAELNRPRQRVRYGFGEGHQGSSYSSEDGVASSTEMFLNEEQDQEKVVHEFIEWAADRLGIDRMPEIFIHTDPEWSVKEHSFGRYEPRTHRLHVNMANRHLLDILRTTAHELVHCRQNQDRTLPANAGHTGSRWENEAHAKAGVIMRDFADAHPELFDTPALTEGRLSRSVAAGAIALAASLSQAQEYQQQPNPTLSALNTALKVYRLSKITAPGVKEQLTQELKNYIRAQNGDPGAQNQSWAWQQQQQQLQEPPQGHTVKENASGYIPKNKKEAQDPRYSMALTVDIKPGEVGRQANKMALKTDSQGRPALLMKTTNLREGRNRDLNDPLGPETPPTMPKGTLRVDVSDVYDWYKLGQHISNMKGLGKHDFGAGPPSSIISFGDEETEHKFIKDLKATGLDVTDIDPKDPKQPAGMRKIKTDPTYNVSEAFDQPYPIQWEESDYGDIDALAKLDDGTYLSIMFNNSGLDSWTVEFHRNNSQEVTGEGDAPRVFATVLTAIQQFIQEHNPHIVYFSAVKDQDPKGSRAKLYDRLVQRYASQLGYSVKRTTRDDEVGYNLVRIRQNVAEIDIVESLRREFAMLENEVLGEIKMSTSSLRAEAAKTGALAGMEFEMIVPDVGGVDVEPEYERDEDQDRRARSFDDIEEFFYDGDYNGRGDVRRLREALDEAYQEWKMDQVSDDWIREGLDYMRDYIENNDLFDREEALDTARDEIIDANPDLPTDSEEFQQLVNARINELQEEFVQNEFDAQGNLYNEAFTEFTNEKSDDYDEGDFLRDMYPYMSDIESQFDIQWPYYYDINADREGEANVDEVADEFSEAIGKPVNASTSYHGARREPGHYVVEPDGSLEGDEPGDTGLEFVSPPLPIDELLSDLNKVKEWAGSRGCYTNDSTGLHINISVPNYSLDKLDYVKLALLMGDEYVLELFGRSGNYYAKAATGKIRTALQKNPDLAPVMMDKMRGHMEDLATKAIHSGTTDKYTSINTKSGYIEFRSPGGDWLDANFDKIENTLLRFTVALSAAIDPQAYRQEYLKKLYKLLEGSQEKGDVDVVQLFSNYSAGELDKAALIRQVREKQLARDLAKGRTPPGQKFWWRVTNPANTMASIEVVAAGPEEAKAKAVEPNNYPEWAKVQNTLRATPLRPYQETEKKPEQTGNWGIWITSANRFARAPGQSDNSVLRRFPGRDSALQWIEQARRENPNMRTDIEVREIEPAVNPGSITSGNWGVWVPSLDRWATIGNAGPRRFENRADAEAWIQDYNQRHTGSELELQAREIEPQQGSGAYTFRVFTTDGNQTVGTFQASGIQGSTNANIAFRNYLTSIGRDSVAGFNYEQIGRERQQPEFVDTTTQSSRGDLTPRGPGPWEIYQLSNNQAVRPLEHTSRPAAEQEARSALGLRGWDPTDYGVRTRQQQPQPLGAGREFVGWKIVDSQGRTIHEFSGIGNAQADANAFAINWLRRNPQHMQAGVEVVPNWREA